ncbi:MAG: cytochrome c-type biogenesis CcmF C-terminal domain-containing protein, partial [Acidobacteriota bacterium]|nr:cytochrome c-type biogenesis CcmF C-terminal domain-containing protein [Acidobacteriota bacterium]
PFFNKVAIPMGLLLLLLTGAGPLLAWRKTSFQSLKGNFTLPLIVASVAGVALFAGGMRHLYAWMTLVLSVFVTVCILGEFWKGARTRMRTAKENFAQALYNLTMRNTRRYGGYIVHISIVLLFVGFAGQAFKTDAKALMQEGDLLHVGNYMLRCDGLINGDNPNYEYTRALFTVTKNGQAFTSMHPEKRFYKASQQPTSHVAIHPSLSEDLYVVLAGMDPDTGKAIIQVFVNPLVMWVWIGGLVFMLGTLLSMVPSRVEREMAEIRQAQELAVQAGDAF